MPGVVRTECEDGISFRSWESEVDKDVKFGPLKSSLYDLIDMGFSACAFFSHYKARGNHRVGVYLERKSERYLIARKSFRDVESSKNLFFFCKDGTQMIRRIASPDDVWRGVAEKYPPLPRPDFNIGNMSLKEWVLEELKH